MSDICLLYTTFNRAHLLRNSLERLCTLTAPEEILVVDDGGSDGCEEMVASFADRLPVRYLYHHNPQVSICSYSRNIGVKNTDCDLILTSEPEMIFLTDVVAQMRERHEQHPMDSINAGHVYHAQSEGVTDPAQCTETWLWVATWVALYGRQWLLDIGGWDEEFPGSWGWEDTDLITRLGFAGHGQQRDGTIEVLHQWHPHNNDNQNEPHFLSKRDAGAELMIANQGREWGCLTPRP